MQSKTGDLYIWTIFENPKDYPGKFVVRRFVILDTGAMPTPDVSVHENLDCARQAIPQGLVCLNRDPAERITGYAKRMSAAPTCSR